MCIVIRNIAKYQFGHPFPVLCRNMHQPLDYLRQLLCGETANLRHRVNHRINAGAFGQPLEFKLIDVDHHTLEIDRILRQNLQATRRNLLLEQV